MGLRDVGRRHLPVPGRFGLVGQLVQLQGALHGHVTRQVGELHLDQLLGVEGPVPVGAGAHRLRQHYARRVHGLE